MKGETSERQCSEVLFFPVLFYYSITHIHSDTAYTSSLASFHRHDVNKKTVEM